MIYEDDFEINGQSYNHCIELTDWRFSATALGMIRFLIFMVQNIIKRKENYFITLKI
ncbi:hypothetical protein HMPREF9943_01751 [Eggerthia catenaformis OT 569 = DSM 20559]|uniref:Uncharacterized protein n=1 Tax=Eggerthia catenaformis OT 569 = DSM 20559 TaxID=999415 RepID=M2NCL9_9FIRM|nr:hypothetical protein [Eggerthia catenaformis]EMD15918.1 hypothetical protein HMPREF9943_01751 [Eggerthia catenaformis OT 569 = DSM 20559]